MCNWNFRWDLKINLCPLLVQCVRNQLSEDQILVFLNLSLTSDPCEGDIHERVSPAAARQVRQPLRDARRQPLGDPPLQEERRQEHQGTNHI